jgi:hypothetical protein
MTGSCSVKAVLKLAVMSTSMWLHNACSKDGSLLATQVKLRHTDQLQGTEIYRA